MAIPEEYRADAEAILARRHDNGADLWATPDGRLNVGSPFTTIGSAHLLLELGMSPGESPLPEVAELLLGAWRADGRFRLSPGAIYPCHTIGAARALCHLGRAGDARLVRTLEYLLETQQPDGGWTCNKYSFGRGEETKFSNPGPTLAALDAFRFTPYLDSPALGRAAAFLLDHWTIRRPIGPCHYGIGSRFLRPEYPFGNYNLFPYVHALSFYRAARNDTRFHEALALLKASLVDGQFVVEHVNPKLAKFGFCKKGAPSALAAARYREILINIG